MSRPRLWISCYGIRVVFAWFWRLHYCKVMQFFWTCVITLLVLILAFTHLFILSGFCVKVSIHFWSKILNWYPFIQYTSKLEYGAQWRSYLYQTCTIPLHSVIDWFLILIWFSFFFFFFFLFFFYQDLCIIPWIINYNVEGFVWAVTHPNFMEVHVIVFV